MNRLKKKPGFFMGVALVVSVLFLAACELPSLSGRTVVVEELNGTVSITGKDEEKKAVKGEKLTSGNYVEVKEASDLTIKMDKDKFLYAEENTGFALKAWGKEGSSRTLIVLDAGSTLIRIDNKLKEDETFEVETPNSIMAVRGTEFKVNVFYDMDGVPVTEVNVTKGKVETAFVTESGRETIDLGAGESAVIYGEEKEAERYDSIDDVPGSFYEEPECFHASGTVYEGFQYYSELKEQYDKKYKDLWMAYSIIVFDEPVDYNGEKLDHCIFTFDDPETPPESTYINRHLDLYGYWGPDHQMLTDVEYDMTLDAVGNLHVFYAVTYKAD